MTKNFSRFFKFNYILTLAILTCSLAFLGGCFPFPEAPPYPHQAPKTVTQDAEIISNKLENQIKLWLQGKAPSAIPNSLIAQGIGLASGIQDNKNFYLINPDKVDPKKIWAYRLAEEINLNAVKNQVPDPHATYLMLATPLAPFGSKIVVEGEFPHARYFGIQITPPLDGLGYLANRIFGSAEVLLVDADIDPLPGNINPFRVGASRNAPNRKYQVTFDLTTGNPVSLNPSHKPPYRGRGNSRVGSMLVYQGPWGVKGPYGIKMGSGLWNLGSLVIRIYAPDRETNALGGVPLPKVWFELPTGEKYLISSDWSKFQERLNNTMKARKTNPSNPKSYYGPTVGWYKSFGIVRSLLEGAGQAWGRRSNKDLEKIRKIDLGVTGRGEDTPPPGNYEPSATSCNNNTYIGRMMSLGQNKVIVLTGKMPRFPATRNGEKVMQGGQLRYWSISGYDYDFSAKLPGSVIHSVMDDEVVLDSERRYIIVYSRPEDRPVNATQDNKVTWVNWGPTSELGLILRWMTVASEWSFELSPDERHLPWTTAAWSGKHYDKSLLNENTQEGFMGEYLPKVHYMSKKEFERLGSSFNPQAIPDWTK